MSLQDELQRRISSPAFPFTPVAPIAPSLPVKGDPKKRDAGKPRFDLFEEGMPDAILGVVEVLTWAVEVKEYKPHSWREVQDAIRRYEAAVRRHQNAKRRGERYDQESGKLHDLHIACGQLFIAQLELEADKLRMPYKR